MPKIEEIGADWVGEQVEGLTEEIEKMTPVEFNELNRYLPASVSSIEGYIRFDVNPFMIEILNCFDVDSPVREVNLKKGVQITFTTLLESVALYYMAFVKTSPMMYLTADKELAEARIENNFIPMLQLSDLGHIIRSSDETSKSKTGKTKNHIQHEGGGYLVPFGARNANKMRAVSICVMLKDEVDAFPETVGDDGDPDALTDKRCKGYWEDRKIFRGSTPLIKGTSKIEKAYLRGDQRKYMVRCKSPDCRHPQELRWHTEDKTTGVIGGFKWDMNGRTLDLDSVRYCCQVCGQEHYESDKERLFSPEYGAEWVPTADPVEPGIRSYHLPALYSPIGLGPWHLCVSSYLAGYDPETKKVIDIGKYQDFYNNILGEPFEVLGSRVTFQAVSRHRRHSYRKGEIPNEHAKTYAGSEILFLTCQVDVHKSNLAVAVMGWCVDSKPYVVDYRRLESDDCREISAKCWGQLRSLIEEKVYTADDGKEYRVMITLVDAGYAQDTAVAFCADYESGVYPILGRDRPAKNQKVEEFGEWRTKAGTIGYRILVDHYKDRIAPVLRREWVEESGDQERYHFNAPTDITDDELRELTRETRKKKIDPNGVVTYVWHRPSGQHNEFWDLLVYGHAAVEIFAWNYCIGVFELETIDWNRYWQHLRENRLYYVEPTP